MASNTFRRRRQYRLIDQKIALMKSYPGTTCRILRGALTWEGMVRPTALSRAYQLTVTYKVGYRPQVSVSGDGLPGLERPDFPHKFAIDRKNNTVKICLHLRHEFSESMLISDCIIPWAVEWLYFYEIWLATGEWCGGGKHPGNNSPTKKRAQVRSKTTPGGRDAVLPKDTYQRATGINTAPQSGDGF